MSTVTFTFDTLLADSMALVSVSCEVDQNGDIAEFNHVLYEGFNVYDILSDNQWTELEWDAKKAYDLEYAEQQTIDYDLDHA
jgi:hypothetical protein